MGRTRPCMVFHSRVPEGVGVETTKAGPRPPLTIRHPQLGSGTR